ncbi:hypothetical protein ACSVH5_02150 [Flavobacterium sp. RSSA_27]|uniref:hypothetical protein n=1 Tax=Flavobacterium sp. RSSA_27 TaxID=3447667 RepID=UPI003F2B7EB3
MKIVETKNINKIAEITVLFWIMKIVATTLGETLGDFISLTLNLGYLTGIAITIAVFYYIITPSLTKYSYFGWLFFTRPFGATFEDFFN